jgi:hypothetical protein
LMQGFGSQIQNQIEQLYSFEYNIAIDYKVTLKNLGEVLFVDGKRHMILLNFFMSKFTNI